MSNHGREKSSIGVFSKYCVLILSVLKIGFTELDSDSLIVKEILDMFFGAFF